MVSFVTVACRCIEGDQYEVTTDSLRCKELLQSFSQYLFLVS